MATVTDQLKGAAALAALEASGQLFCYPADVAAVLGIDLRSVYAALERGEIPHTRVSQRYRISVAWLRRPANGEPEPASQPLPASVA